MTYRINSTPAIFTTFVS